MKNFIKYTLIFLLIAASFNAYAGVSIFDRGPDKKDEGVSITTQKTANLEALFVSGDYDNVIKNAYIALSRSSNKENEIRILLGRALLKLKRYYEARVNFTKVIESKDGQKYLAEANLGMGDSYYLEGKYKEAKDYYEKIPRYCPDSDTMNIVYYRLSECYSKMDDFETAKIYNDKLLRLYPDSLEAKLMKGEGADFIIYSVQVGSFNKQENAQKLCEELKIKGFDAAVSRGIVNDETFYRVRVGKYNRLRDAEDMAENLKDKGYSIKICP